MGFEGRSPYFLFRVFFKISFGSGLFGNIIFIGGVDAPRLESVRISKSLSKRKTGLTGCVGMSM